MIVRFNQRYGPYSSGERAGFPDREARRLLDERIAEPDSAPTRKRGRPRKDRVEAKPEPGLTITK